MVIPRNRASSNWRKRSGYRNRALHLDETRTRVSAHITIRVLSSVTGFKPYLRSARSRLTNCRSVGNEKSQRECLMTSRTPSWGTYCQATVSGRRLGDVTSTSNRTIMPTQTALILSLGIIRQSARCPDLVKDYDQPHDNDCYQSRQRSWPIICIGDDR